MTEAERAREALEEALEEILGEYGLETPRSAELAGDLLAALRRNGWDVRELRA